MMIRAFLTSLATFTTAAITGFNITSFWWIYLTVAATIWYYLRPQTDPTMLFTINGETGETKIQPQDKAYQQYMNTRK
jgi:hypothetical protein